MILIPHRISREYIIQHPDFIFVHSRCFWRNQKAGPSAICDGLSNCFGVSVRWKLCKSSGYFSDSQEPQIKSIIDADIEAIPRSTTVILFPKIGNGASQMNRFAPKCWAYMMQQLNNIKSSNYAYDYTAQ